MKQEICDVMRDSYNRGWITSRDGNCSIRHKERNCMWITPSGFQKMSLNREDIIRLKFDSNHNVIIPDGKEPSGELHMHKLILENSSYETRAVLHIHATHIVAAIHAGFNLPDIAREFPEIYRYTKVGPTVPALEATSKELGDSTAEALGLELNGELEYDIVGQANHGVCSVGKDPWQALEHIERLNHICEIVLLSK